MEWLRRASGGQDRALSLFADLDLAPDGQQELVLGRAALKSDGSQLWFRDDLPDGFPAVGDFDGDGKPDVVLVGGKEIWILKGADGSTLFGPLTLPGSNQAGPPTVADFDGDGKAEIGVAQDNFYSLVKPQVGTKQLTLLWKAPNHDFSSSVTGSTVFDFEGDGSAEVIYNDECFLWVYGGKTGEVLFATPTTSFTATEASLVADVDGDGHAEIVMVSNGADPKAGGTWPCMDPEWLLPDGVRPGWTPPPGESVYRGITVFGDKANSWVGTRTLWNQHTYHVSNICDDHDSACDTPNVYGAIPKKEKSNWTLPWLNNFRQNVQDQGIFNAPDGVLTLSVDCVDPYVLRAALRNIGLAILPAGVEVGFYHRDGGDTLLGTATTVSPLFPGQAMELTYATNAQSKFGKTDVFVAKIQLDSNNPLFHECREDNNVSNEAQYPCDIVK